MTEENTVIEEVRRIVGDSLSEEDIHRLISAINQRRTVSANGERAVTLGGGANDTTIVTGSHNFILQQFPDEIVEKLSLLLSGVLPAQSSPVSATGRELVSGVRSRLHDHILRLHGTMPLWAVDRHVSLGKLFVDVHILEETSSNRRSELSDLWRDFKRGSSYGSLERIGLGERSKRVSGLEILDRSNNLVVLGKPGAGKTTYLQRIVTECIAGTLQPDKIPSLIRLRDFVDDGRALDYSVERYLGLLWNLSKAETETVLKEGQALILIDGLDEVAGADGQAINKQIRRFARTYPLVKVILTCRTQTQQSRFDRFDYVEVADFDESQTTMFVQHWFQAICTDPDEAHRWEATFLSQLHGKDNRPIRELAVIPILLSLTCAVFYQTGKFYSKRSKLYEEGLEMLLEKWDESRGIQRDKIYKNLSVEEKIRLLSYLSIKKFSQGQYVLFEQSELEGYIGEALQTSAADSRAVIKAIETQHGLLIERARGIYSFSHLTFQEYLAAKFMCERRCWGWLAINTAHKPWRELIIMSCELANSEELLLEIEQQINSVIAKHEGIRRLCSRSSQAASASERQKEATANRVAALAIAYVLCFMYPFLYERAKSRLYMKAKAGYNAYVLANAISFAHSCIRALSEASLDLNLTNFSMSFSNAYGYGIEYYPEAIRRVVDFLHQVSRTDYMNCVDVDRVIIRNALSEMSIDEHIREGRAFEEYEESFRHLYSTFLTALSVDVELIDLASEEIESLYNLLYSIQLLADCINRSSFRCTPIARHIQQRLLLSE